MPTWVAGSHVDVAWGMRYNQSVHARGRAQQLCVSSDFQGTGGLQNRLASDLIPRVLLCLAAAAATSTGYALRTSR